MSTPRRFIRCPDICIPRSHVLPAPLCKQYNLCGNMRHFMECWSCSIIAENSERRKGRNDCSCEVQGWQIHWQGMTLLFRCVGLGEKNVYVFALICVYRSVMTSTWENPKHAREVRRNGKGKSCLPFSQSFHEVSLLSAYWRAHLVARHHWWDGCYRSHRVA